MIPEKTYGDYILYTEKHRLVTAENKLNIFFNVFLDFHFLQNGRLLFIVFDYESGPQTFCQF